MPDTPQGVKVYNYKVYTNSEFMIVCNTHLTLTGELLTTAAWIRTFVMCHPDYKQDLVV